MTLETSPLTSLRGARPPARPRAAMVRGALERLDGSRTQRPVLVFAAALAAVSASVLVQIGSHYFSARGRPAASLEVLADASARLERRGDDLVLDRGRVHVRAPRPLRLITPDVELRLVQGAFAADRVECTVVMVESGRVLARAHGAERWLESPVRVEFCPATAAPIERAAAADPAPGAELVAEATQLLSRRDRLDRAEALLREYLSRHPGGLFEEEALFELWLLRSDASRSDAEGLAGRFLDRFPSSDRAAMIKTWRSRQRAR